MVKMLAPWGQVVDIDPKDVPVRKSWGYKEVAKKTTKKAKAKPGNGKK